MTAPTEPVTLVAADDDGTSGWRVAFETPARDTFLIADGASVYTQDNHTGLTISLRSRRADFEGDSLYLLRATLVPAYTSWVSHFVVVKGVLTELLYRTEEDVDREIVDCPSGDGIYVPKGPMPLLDAYYRGGQVSCFHVEVRIGPRR